MPNQKSFGQNSFALKNIRKSIFLLAAVILNVEAIIDVRSKIGNSCKTDNECHYFLEGWEYCKIKENATKGFCMHKDLFPLKTQEFWGMIGTIGVLTMVNIGGISGGGTMVPTSQGFFNFDSKNAIAISNISIFLASIIRYLLLARVPHPLKNGKGLQIDHGISSIMLPMIISGVSIGSIAGLVLPNLAIIVCYAVFLVLIGFQLAIKAYNMVKTENQQRNQIQDENQNSKIEFQMLKSAAVPTLETETDQEKTGKRSQENTRQKQIEESSNKNSQEDNKSVLNIQEKHLNLNNTTNIILQEARPSAQKLNDQNDQNEIEDQKAKKLEEIIKNESTALQWYHLNLNWGIIIIQIIIYLLKGSPNPADSLLNIDRCDLVDWMLFMILHVVCFAFTFIAIHKCNQDYQKKVECNYKFVPGDLKLNIYNVSMFMFIGWFGAFISAFCGIGGGMIFCPILVIVGIEARVATATGMYLTLFTSLSYTIISIVQHQIYLEYAGYILAMTAIGTFIGMFFQNFLVKTYQRVSIQVITLNTLVFCALIASICLNVPVLEFKMEIGQSIYALSDYCSPH